MVTPGHILVGASILDQDTVLLLTSHMTRVINLIDTLTLTVSIYTVQTEPVHCKTF